MSGKCDATDEVKAILRAMARAKIKEGVTDPHEILDAIHEVVSPHTDLSKGDIADIVSGYGKVRKATNDELKQKINAINREMRDLSRTQDILSGKIDPNAGKNTARQKALAKLKAEYEDRIARGDFDPVPKREPPKYDDTTLRMQAEVNDAKNRWEQALHADKLGKRSQSAKIADMLVELHRTAILASPTVVAKLGSAAMLKLATKPAEEAVGNALSHVGPFGKIAAKAPSEGRGSLAIERAALGETFSKATVDRMKQSLTKGTYDIKSAHGDYEPAMQGQLALSRLVGNIHDTLKVPAKVNVWKRSLLKRMEYARRDAEAQGMTPEQVRDHMQDPLTEAAAAAGAWQDAQRETLQGRNLLNDWHKMGLAMLKARAEKVGPNGKTDATGMAAGATARVLNYLLPVTNVPVNWAIAKSSYALGGAAAYGHALSASDKGIKNKLLLKGAIDGLTPDQADAIMRNMKRQLIGAPLMAMGIALYKNFGGMYQQGDSKNKLKPDSESIKTPAGNISKTFLENPWLGAMQIGATMAWVANKAHGDKWEAAMAGVGGIYGDTPFTDTPREVARTLENPKEMGKFVGEQARSFIPVLPWLAKVTDPADKRKPRDGWDAFKMGIPGLREDVPRSQ